MNLLSTNLMTPVIVSMNIVTLAQKLLIHGHPTHQILNIHKRDVITDFMCKPRRDLRLNNISAHIFFKYSSSMELFSNSFIQH